MYEIAFRQRTKKTMSESIQFDDISVSAILRNMTPARLYEEALHHERGSIISDQGALVVSSGNKTGRSPSDKRIVFDPQSSADIWWGAVNIKLQEHTFMINLERASGLSQHLRAVVCGRWIRRLGSSISAQNPRDLLPRIPRNSSCTICSSARPRPS